MRIHGTRSWGSTEPVVHPAIWPVGGIFAVGFIAAVVVGNVFLIGFLFNAANRLRLAQQGGGMGDELPG